jgi:hypothetical protein
MSREKEDSANGSPMRMHLSIDEPFASHGIDFLRLILPEVVEIAHCSNRVVTLATEKPEIA